MRPGSRGDAPTDTGGRMLFRLKDFPNLSPGNHRDTGLADGKYNCIAWAAGIDNDWWDPATNRYWPANAPRDYKVTSLIVAFESVGYAVCADGAQRTESRRWPFSRMDLNTCTPPDSSKPE